MGNTAELGDVLVHDLATVLDKDFGSKGSFAYSENRPDAPNPFLTIADIGSIGLPLSEIDAKRIIACATQAPFGLGTSTASTVIDKEVRDTWQIDPSLVSFQNPAWDSFLQSTTANICSGLGLPGGCDVQYKLHKLLLYETGSLFRPHPEFVEDGMFATMAIVLPSQYIGGEIIVSHGSISKVIDVSASCMTSISVLSWCTDVEHEVKPIRSGYRLVLSYNLMRSPLSGPEVMPTADNTSELSRLHEILERWRTGGYKQLPEQRMVALVLGHQYPESDLSMGQAGLNGQDSHKVNQIRSVAEMLGFELWLGEYERCTARLLEDDSNEGNDGNRDGGDPNSDGEAIISRPPGQVMEDLCTLKYLTDLQGSQALGTIRDFDSKGLIMGDPDHLGDPDDSKRFDSEYGGNSVIIKHYYYRAVLVIFPKEDWDQIVIVGCGVKGVLAVLQKLLASLSIDPTLRDRKLAGLLLEYIKGRDIWLNMLVFPLLWHDLDLWNRTIERCPSPLITLEEEGLLFHAWDIFGFQQVQSSYKTIISKICPIRGDQIDFIHNVKARVAGLDEQEIVETWCSEQIAGFLKGSNAVNHMNVLISIAKEDGIKFLKDFNNENQHIRELNYYQVVYTQIISLFMSEKENIYASPANKPGGNKGEDLNQIFEDFLDKCIRGAICYLDEQDFLWSTEYIRGGESSYGQLNNILDVVESCITTNRVDECATLFRLIWDAKGNAYDKLMFYYIPLLQELRKKLLSPPFAPFARNVIGYYFSRMLGSKTHNPRPSLQMLPCDEGCSACASLREFLEQLYVPVQDFCASRKTREHFLIVLSQLSDFISFTEVTRGRYRVAKRPDFLKSNRWEYRLKEARDILRSIGGLKYIKQIMGDQFKELNVALKGKRSYDYTGPLPKHEPDEVDLDMHWKMTYDMEQDDI
ncbi:hypothetical protein M378DRAFT_171556 [Amanita muscaria Koide BX008]|uniref:Prolyl 4-hydroxylase alpha subunit Fe(2+) 2OG dioxygenase domain-containing protein n=1 Tax=Amanita muscaria (strain Koide BX008) TaxID=946122 RepID=A0A0C2W8V5_AMAMK|nr:hypothetical protein M378DRAFT_171556 [Amanita muscaria Koide BX008]